MKRFHPMPFGAEVGDDGVRFRLWAPAARGVQLKLMDELIAMQPQPQGWFELSSQTARPGERYCFRIEDGNGGIEVPDPASRYNPDGVHATSEIVDPGRFDWQDGDWRGRPWEEAVVYELHLGAFTPQGGYAGAMDKLDYLVELGVTAIQLMPLAAAPGARNWGYDGVLPFAPNAGYGSPDELKRLVQSAHDKGLMVMLDVVYNHFGPEGNYLHRYAPQFFTDRHATPWGAALNFDGPDSRPVRDFFIHNALYWLEEYHFDGLRLDAVHAIKDDSETDLLSELAAAVRRGPGRERRVHLVLENDDNAARYLGGYGLGHYDAQWNDDIHHAFHVVLTREDDGYYADYADRPLYHLGRCLAEGFAYQGEASRHRDGARRGEPSVDLPPRAFVNFLQNHDQIGNRAFGERLHRLAEPQALAAAVAVLLLAPAPPLLFMGEEFASPTPFLFFCDFGAELAAAVTEGRRREFARFAPFRDPEARAAIPDPNDPATFRRSRLDWESLQLAPQRACLDHYRRLLALRRERLAARLPGTVCQGFELSEGKGLTVRWRLGDGSGLTLLANLTALAITSSPPCGTALFASAGVELTAQRVELPAWTVLWLLEDKHG